MKLIIDFSVSKLKWQTIECFASLYLASHNLIFFQYHRSKLEYPRHNAHFFCFRFALSHCLCLEFAVQKKGRYNYDILYQYNSKNVGISMINFGIFQTLLSTCLGLRSSWSKLILMIHDITIVAFQIHFSSVNALHEY